MIISPSKQSVLVTKKYPFLKNFPFSEFEMEIGEMPKAPNFLFDDEDSISIRQVDPKLIKFRYTIEKSNFAIVISDQELMWISEVAAKIKDLDRISKTINRGLKTRDLILKRDVVEAAEDWCALIHDNRTSLSYSTMGEILASLIRNKNQMLRVLNQLGHLNLKKGLVSLSSEEYSIILTYYHFQLIYTKLILGLVIASKISI